jgi:ADP-ribose pyrophosphatase
LNFLVRKLSISLKEEMPMFSDPPRPDDASPWVKILDLAEDYSFGKLFRIIRATLQYRRFDGQMSEPVTRINFERGDSVGVLLYDPQDDAVVLVRQFRYPVYASLDPDERTGDGAKQAWLLEIVAGVQDAGRTVRDVAHKELLEEAGYQVKGDLQPINTIYPSPGGTSERIHLFLGEVDLHQRTGKGGGVAAEGENVQIVVLPFREAMDRVARGEIHDAKTIIALQHLALLRAGNADLGEL